MTDDNRRPFRRRARREHSVVDLTGRVKHPQGARPASVAVPREARAAHWAVEVFVGDDGTAPYERFVDELSDFEFDALDTAIERVLAVRGIELVRTEWLKALGGGIHEFRVRRSAAEIARMFGGQPPQARRERGRVLLRVFLHFYGERVILLLGGYDQGEDPKERRQQREIAKARRSLAEFKARQRRKKRRR